MTKTTSLELSKKIFEAFPKWKDCYWAWFNGNKLVPLFDNEPTEFLIPAYTTDFLLDKLPKEIESGTLELVVYADHWEAAYSDARDALWDTNIGSHASKVPAEALGGLALRLKEKGLLK